MNKNEKLALIVLDQKKNQELSVKISYQIKMLAIQYKNLGFTEKQIAETYNKSGLLTPKFKRRFTASSVAKLIREEQ